MNFLNGSIKVGRLFEIDVRVHFLLLIWTAYRLIQDPSVFTGIFLGLLYLIVLIHEYGHCFGARAVGGDAQVILMWPLGGIAYPWAPMRPWPQFVTVAAGPLVNVLFCLISGIIMAVVGGGFTLNWLNPMHFAIPAGGPVWVFYLAIFYRVNIILLAFNMLPIYPLDGGQIFRAILWPFIGLQRATILACQVGIGGAIVFGVFGIQHGEYFLVFIALFVGMGCYQSLQAAKFGVLREDDGYMPPPRGNLWQRMFKLKPKRRSVTPTPTPNPNPGGWEQKQVARSRAEAEIDRILKKVKEHGLASLSYVEQQQLKKATEQRRNEDRDFDRRTNL